MNCPICDKAGLMENTAICPQCNSDLSGFLLIHEIEKQHGKDKVNIQKLETSIVESNRQKRNIIIGSSILVLSMFGVLLWFGSTNVKSSSTDSNNYKKYTDSIQILQKQNHDLLQKMQSQPTITTSKTIKYKVRQGDDLTTIARFFYNNDEQYRQIMKDNNLQNPIIHVGDSLTINLNTL